MSVTGAIIGGVGAMGSIAGGAIASSGAQNAADAQVTADMNAAQLTHDSATQALDFQKQVYGDQKAATQPYTDAGGKAITTLSSLMRPGGALTQPWDKNFVAPTAATEVNDPGYKFRLDQGTQALERSAAARGGLLSGGTAKGLTQFAQDYASGEYNNVYNRSFNEYQQAYNQFQNNQATQYNRYAGLAGTGQVGTGQLINAGNNAANTNASILMGSANSIANSTVQAGAARASGYINKANAWTGATDNITGSFATPMWLKALSPASGISGLNSDASLYQATGGYPS